MSGSRRAAQGLALISALLVVAIAAILAVGLSYSGALNFKRLETQTRLAQSQAYARGLEGIALRVVGDDLKYAGAKDFPGEEWARGLPPLPVSGGLLSGQLVDAAGLFNVNALDPRNPDAPLARERFARLLSALKLDPIIAPRVIDFIDPDDDIEPGGAEDGMYLRLNPPLRAPNRPLAHVLELRAVIGLDALSFSKLLPNVIALPALTPININSAPFPVLMSLSPNMLEAQAKTLALFQQTGYETPDMFVARARDLGMVVVPTQLAASSGWFLADAQVLLGNETTRYQTLIDRSSGTPRVVWRR